MVRPGKIISQRLGTVFPIKIAPRFVPHHDLKRIPGHDLHMFGRDLVGGFHRFVHIFRDKDISEIVQGFLNDLFSGKNLYKLLHFTADFFCQFSAGSDQYGGSQFIVFRLGKKDPRPRIWDWRFRPPAQGSHWVRQWNHCLHSRKPPFLPGRQKYCPVPRSCQLWGCFPCRRRERPQPGLLPLYKPCPRPPLWLPPAWWGRLCHLSGGVVIMI